MNIWLLTVLKNEDLIFLKQQDGMEIVIGIGAGTCDFFFFLAFL